MAALSFTLLVLLALSFLIINLAYFSFNHAKKPFKAVKRKTWLALLLVFVAAFFLRMFITTHMHNLYYDEDAYMDIAKHIANNGDNCLCLKNTGGVCEVCGYSFKSLGFSFLLAGVFKAFGVGHSAAFNFVAVIGALTVLALFLFSYLVFDDEKAALLSALVLAFFPLHVRWSGSASAEVVSLFFIIASFTCLMLYHKLGKARLLFLFLALFVYTLMIKEENVLLVAFFVAFFLSRKKHRKVLLYILSIVMLVMLPYLVGNLLTHIGLPGEDALGRYTFWKEGSYFSMDFLKKDFLTNMLSLLDTDYTMHVVVLLSLVGVFYMLKNKTLLGVSLLSWILVIIALFSAYIGMPLAQSEVRHYIPLIGAVSLISGYGISSLSKERMLKNLKMEYLVAAVLIISILYYLPYITSDKSPVLTAQQDYELAQEVVRLVPEECVIITQESYIFDFFDKSAMSIYIPTPMVLEGICFYYYEGEVCWREDAKGLCDSFKQTLTLGEKVLTNGRHSLYEIKSSRR